MNHSTPFPELNAVLATFLDQTQAILTPNFVGLYLIGSFALGDFDLSSDVDFLVVTHSALSEAQEAALQIMHGAIYDLESEWAKHLEGSYIPASLLQNPDPNRTPLLFLDNYTRVLVHSDHCNTVVTRWMVYEHGIALAGPPAKTLLNPVSSQALQQEVHAVILKWSGQLLAHSERIDNRWYQCFVVLSYCRMLHTLECGKITSKPVAAQWAQKKLDPRWQGLIQRAWQYRPNPLLKSQQQADEDVQSTLEFIEYARSRAYDSQPQGQN